MRSLFEQEETLRDVDKDFSNPKADLYKNVIPRLLRPLETGGRSVKPCLIHSDLWPGNVKPNAHDDKLCIFDACTYWGHNEADLGICRNLRYRLGKQYREEYVKHVQESEPKEDFEDRNALYALKFHVLLSIMYPKDPQFRVT
ncbi:hypothetical protein MMC14_002283 [Varicellaria rhodocarpa]|nr:hypothetical protein [Varicellaria rhodocarpa]